MVKVTWVSVIKGYHENSESNRGTVEEIKRNISDYVVTNECICYLLLTK